MQFNHVGVSVSDLDVAIAFYRDNLGMEQAMEIMPFGGRDFETIMDIPGVEGRMCMMGRDSLRLELFEFAQSEPRNPDYPVSDGGFTHFGVIVDDLDATYEKLRKAGVRIHSPIITFMGGSMRAIYCRDPDGNVFEIMEPGTPAAQSGAQG